MNYYTRADILRIVEEEDVGFIRLQFTDIFGVMKNVAITASQLEKALDHQIMFEDVYKRQALSHLQRDAKERSMDRPGVFIRCGLQSEDLSLIHI